MERKKMLREWYFNEYSTLKRINKEIEEIERTYDYYKKLDKLRSSFLKQWLDDTNLTDVVRDDINGTLEFIPEERERIDEKLHALKIQKESSEFVLSKLDEELNGSD